MEDNIINLITPKLSSLAAELLLQIFEYVDTPITGIVSNDLLPYTRITVYRNIKITTIKSFKQFFRILCLNPSYGLLVKTAEFNIITYSILKSNLLVKDEVILGLKSLKNLQFINLCFDIFASILLSKEVAGTCLPSLKHIKFIYPPLRDEYDWRIPHLKSLRSYPLLEKLSLFPRTHAFADFIDEEAVGGDVDNSMLELDLNRLESEVDLVERYSSSKSSNFSLMIFGTDHLWSPVEDITSLGDITSLDLIHLSPGGADSFLDILRIVKPTVENLSLFDAFSSDTVFTISDIYPTICRFQRLETLSISGNSIFTSTLFQYLRDPLPLWGLHFGVGSSVNISQLEQILTPGIHKLSSLQQLILEIGKFKEVGEGEREFLPRWTVGSFDQVGVRELVRIGEMVDVKVSGASVDAAK